MQFINNIFGSILDVIFSGVAMFTPLGALAIAIIIFTIVARVLLTPLQLSSQRTSRAMGKVQPELNKIENKYKGLKDQQSQLKRSEELRDLYKKYKINPFAGCLPLLIQLPLIMGLFNVLRTPAQYITQLANEYNNIANVVIQNVANYQDKLQAFYQAIEVKTRVKFDLNSVEGLGQYLSHLTTGQWNQFIENAGDGATQEVLLKALQLKHQYEDFIGFNVVDSPSDLMSTQWWAILIPVVAGVSTYIFTKVTMASNGQAQTSANGQPNPAESMMKTMNIAMPIMTGFFAYTMPIGLALYWIAGNVIMLVQQKIVTKMLEKQDAKMDALLEKEREEARKNNKTTVKKVKKKVPVQNKPKQQDKEESNKPKTYKKTVIKKVLVEKNNEE